MKLFDNNKIAIDFNSVICFYFKEEYLFPYNSNCYNNKLIEYLITIIGSKYNKPSELKFTYAEIEYLFSDKEAIKSYKNYQIGKEIHDELVKFFETTDKK